MNFDEIRIGGSWSEVVPSAAPPTLTIAPLTGNQVRITWPVGGSYTLTSSTNLLGPWINAGLSIGTSGGNNVATDTISGSAKFYRLQ